MSWRLHSDGMSPRLCCNAAFCLKHAVAINYAGKTVLVLFGIGIAASPSASDELRIVSGVNVPLMAIGQYWYSVWWEGEVRIQAFVDGPRHGHSLHNCGRCPAFLLTLAASYYAVFTVLFAYAAVLELGKAHDIYYVYAVGATFWNAWCGVLLLLSACLHQVGLKTPNTQVEAKHAEDCISTPVQQQHQKQVAQLVCSARTTHDAARPGTFSFRFGTTFR